MQLYRARQLRPSIQTSIYSNGVINLDIEVANRTLDLGVAEKQLNST
jgi:hypothetical protein